MIADLGTSPDWNYDLGSDHALKETLDDLAPLGEVDSVDLDVTQVTSCQRAIQKTLDTFGQIDVLVNNAGVVDSGQSKVSVKPRGIGSSPSTSKGFSHVENSITAAKSIIRCGDREHRVYRG